MRTAVVPENELLERGVIYAPYLVRGCRVLIAIDSKGEARKHLKIENGITEEIATRWLTAWLDRVDPVPKLELVTPRLVRPHPIVRYTNPVDPNDFRAYRNRLIRNAAQRVRIFRD